MNAPQTPSRPAWLPNGCPAWCDSEDLHKDGDAYDDRTHCGGAIRLPLTADEPLDMRYEGAPVLDLYLIQHYRETEPRVWIGRDGSTQGAHLSLTETADLIRHLAGILATARGGLPTNPGEECPPWCKGQKCDESGHWSVDLKAGPMLAGLFDEDGRTVVSLIVDARLENRDRPLTLDEAEELGRALLELSAAGRAPRIPEGEPWQVVQAREALEASRTAPTTDRDEATRQWGRLEKALDTLLHHVNDRGGPSR